MKTTALREIKKLNRELESATPAEIRELSKIMRYRRRQRFMTNLKIKALRKAVKRLANQWK